MYGVARPGPKLIRREALPRPSQALPREALPRSYLACTSDPSGPLSLIHGASRPLWARSHKCEHATFWRALGSKVPSLVKVKAHRNVESANSD